MVKSIQKLFLLVLLGYGCSTAVPLQKSKTISLFHLIETGKYADAKEIAEELIQGEHSSQWPNTWYARGLLCQNAYREGIKKNDEKLYKLYPDQLTTAWESFEKARLLDEKGRIERQLTPRYILLANDFQEAGVSSFNNGHFQEALNAFEKALQIKQIPTLNIAEDTVLIHNAALAAFESREWAKAANYLNKLHSYSFSPNVTHLLCEVALKTGDSLTAEKVLFEGIKKYDDNEILVLQLSDLLYRRNEPDRAIRLLDEVSVRKPGNPVFHYTKGLIYQKSGNFSPAIEAYEQALKLDTNNVMTYINMAMCYFNKGVKTEELSLGLSDNEAVKTALKNSENDFKTALKWLDKAAEKNPSDPEISRRISELYQAMRQSDKAKLYEKKINGNP